MMIEEQKDDSGSVKPAFWQANCYVQPGCQLYNEDCIETMQRIETGSVDLILTDPPYNTTDCKWDNKIDWKTIWSEWKRIVKDTGSIVLTCQMPMLIEVAVDGIDWYRHRWIWEKDKCGNFLAAKAAPLKYTEDVLVFSKNGFYEAWNNNGNAKGTYNPQMRDGTGKARKTNSKRFGLSSTTISDRPKYNDLIANPETDGIVRYPADIIYFSVPHSSEERIHPTQKPIDLMRYLILTYSNEGDTVFDGYSGSGTTAAACIKENRQFIGSEMSKEYFDKSVERLELLRSQPELF